MDTSYGGGMILLFTTGHFSLISVVLCGLDDIMEFEPEIQGISVGNMV